jgi:hypothetical protein
MERHQQVSRQMATARGTQAQRVAALAEAIDRALTAGSGRSARCDTQAELEARLSAANVAAGPVPALLRKDGGGRLVGTGLHRVGVLTQDEPVGDAAVERSLPLVEIRLPVGVELMQFVGAERPAVPDDPLAVEHQRGNAKIVADLHGTFCRIPLVSIAGSTSLVSGSAPVPKSTTNKKPSKSRSIG